MGIKWKKSGGVNGRQKKKKSKILKSRPLSRLRLVEPINPREAFFGGRTGATTLYHKAEENEEIRYVDVSSEYPYINKYGVYPEGHPEIHLEPENKNPFDCYGLMKIDILPPSHLFNPVFPFRHKIGPSYKLTFPLYHSCVEQEAIKPLFERSFVCTHTGEERMLRGTWCTPEIFKAIEKGYRVIRIHELWHFQEKRLRLFPPYVDTWLKIKQESGGCPAWCQSDEDKATYIVQ